MGSTGETDTPHSEEALWAESERKFRVAQREANRDEWVIEYRRRANVHFAMPFACLKEARRIEILETIKKSLRAGKEGK
jgi:hypothetical protein